MTELVTEVVVDKPLEQEVVEVSPVEEQARTQGWVSKDEWIESGGSENEHRSAKEFVERGELYKSIHNTRRELKQTQAALDALHRHHKYVFEKAYTQAKTDLTQERRMALKAGDLDVVADIEDRMEELNEKHTQERNAMQADIQQSVQSGPPPELVEFVNRNPWYQNDPELREEADAAGFIFLNKGGSRDQLLAHVERKIKQKFPEKFGTKRAAPSPTASGDRTNRKNNSVDVDLNETERSIMKSLVDSGEMTEAAYKSELKRAKGMK